MAYNTLYGQCLLRFNLATKNHENHVEFLTLCDLIEWQLKACRDTIVLIHDDVHDMHVNLFHKVTRSILNFIYNPSL